MPGYTAIDSEGEEMKVWDNPTQDEINEQSTPFFFASLESYLNFKSCGVMPNGGGFLQERTTTVQIIRLFEQESGRFESWYMKNREHLSGEDDE